MSETAHRVVPLFQRRWLCRTALAGLANLLAFLTPISRPLLVWNLTDSAPIGLYRLSSVEPLRRGELVVAWPGAAWEGYAERRGYVSGHIPLIKHVVALAGDRVCADATAVWINGYRDAKRRSADAIGRPLPSWTGCHVLTAEQVLLLNPDSAASFDGRYFGPTVRQDILGRATPLWW